jgi:DNA-binding CsgD family transcriptional regulator
MPSSECVLAESRTADPSAGSVNGPGPALLGRTREVAELRALARAGGGALVLRGEAGAGKTALLTEFAGFTAGRRLLRLAGLEAEADMAWAALHRLLLAFPAELGRLPGRQREAVDIAVGLRDGGAADAVLTEGAVLALLTDAARDTDLALIVDDLQWLDRQSLAVLHAVARRAGELPLVLAAAAGEPAPGPVLAGVRELTVGGLADDFGTDLLMRQAGVVLDRRTAGHLAPLAGGNPLALLEIGRRLAAGQADVVDLLCGQQLPGPPLPGRFTAEIRALPQASRALLTLAACDAGGNTRTFWQAASALGLDPSALHPAQRAQVVRPGPGVRFRHPLLLAAAADLASPAQWRAAHQALAEASGQRAEADARAWHRAAAATAADEEIAAELAIRAREAPGDNDPLRTAIWLTGAARLSVTEAADHYLAAAAAAAAASAPRLADDLLGRARPGCGRGLRLAQAQRLTARLDGMLGRPAGESPRTMLVSAGRLAASDRQAGLAASQEAAQLAISTGPYTRRTTPSAIGSALLDRSGQGVPGPLLTGLATLLRGNYGRAVPFLRQALQADRRANDPPGADAARIYAARTLWDDEYLLAWRAPAAQPAPRGRGSAGPGIHDLAGTLASRSAALAGAGHLDEADWLAAQGRRLARSVGWGEDLLAALNDADLHAWRGNGPATQQAVSQRMAAAARLERADMESSAIAALMTLHLSRCRYAEAFAAAEPLITADLGGIANQALVVLVEAGTRLGRRCEAERALARLKARAVASGTAWALGMLSGCEALLASDTAAADAYERSIALLDRTGVISERARARLLYGEWLRRRRQRAAARDWLSAAARLFGQMGAAEYARRAQRELDATSPPRPRAAEPLPRSAGPGLTRAERRIAELAAGGATNKEIAAELSVSRRTIDHHLRNTYGKLGVSSRRQLTSALPPGSPEHPGSR